METSSWLSKSIKITVALVLAAAAVGFVDSAKAVSFAYVSNPLNGSEIHFQGGGGPNPHTFTFLPTTNNIVVTTGTCAGCFGEITGTFTIGTITPIPGGAMAPVTGTGTFVIHDGLGNNLTASLTWVDITQIGTSGTLNISGALNLTGITYSGLNPDLRALAHIGSASNTLDFTFNPGISLFMLRNAGQHNTTFSGTVTAGSSTPDGGASVALLGIALAGVGGVRRILRARKT
jgi:hypothetical protein